MSYYFYYYFYYFVGLVICVCTLGGWKINHSITVFLTAHKSKTNNSQKSIGKTTDFDLFVGIRGLGLASFEVNNHVITENLRPHSDRTRFDSFIYLRGLSDVEVGPLFGFTELSEVENHQLVLLLV